MFAKVFKQIFNSSIAEDYTIRHVFMDLLVLADSDGVVDMTPEAISRITNVPFEIVRNALEKLAIADDRSRSDHEEGKRIVLIDSHRDWGWQIVNYSHYRNVVDEESRKAYFRDKQREYRSNKSKMADAVKGVSDNSISSKEITQGEGEGEEEGEGKAEAINQNQNQNQNQNPKTANKFKNSQNLKAKTFPTPASREGLNDRRTKAKTYLAELEKRGVQ